MAENGDRNACGCPAAECDQTIVVSFASHGVTFTHRLADDVNLDDLADSVVSGLTAIGYSAPVIAKFGRAVEAIADEDVNDG